MKERAGGAEEVAYFSGLQKTCAQQFVFDQLSQFSYYGAIIAFVKDIGPLVESNEAVENITHPKFNAGMDLPVKSAEHFSRAPQQIWPVFLPKYWDKVV